MKFLFLCAILSLLLVGGLAAQTTAKANEGSTPENRSTKDLTPYQRVSMYMGHSLFKAKPIERQSEILWGIKSIKPVLEISKEIDGDFDAEKLEQKIITSLRSKAIPINRETGHLLLFRIRGVWDKGKKNLLYTYDLDLVDKIYVSRDGQIKANFRSIWNVSNLGFAGKDVFQNAMYINVDSAIDRFSISYYEQLDHDIISDTPKQANLAYQRIRDGDEDIVALLSDETLSGQ